MSKIVEMTDDELEAFVRQQLRKHDITNPHPVIVRAVIDMLVEVGAVEAINRSEP